METSEPFNLPIDIETTLEEDTAVYENTTLVQSYASSPLQEHESQVMSELCKLNVLNVCCDKHEDSLPYLIMQYVHIRFHTESKRFRNIHLSSDRTQMKTNKKLSRIPNSAEIQCEKVKEKETANTTDKT